MDALRRIWNNSNLHIFLGMACSIAAASFPALALPLTVAGGVLGVNGIMLPEKGSLHADDYAKIVQSVLAALPGRQ